MKQVKSAVHTGGAELNKHCEKNRGFYLLVKNQIELVFKL